MLKFPAKYVAFVLCLIGLISAREFASAQKPSSKTKFAIQKTHFTMNGKPTFLLGISYYGALGAPKKFIERDLDEMQKHGFNWIRVWANWAAFGANVAAVDGHGKPRPAYMKKLQWLVDECDRRGMVVDVTLTRSNGITGPARLQSLADHRRAVEAVCRALKGRRNWYLDLSNERNIGDKRFASFADLKALRQTVRKLAPHIPVTASQGGDISRDDLKKYLLFVGVDFITPHRPRNAKSPQQTEAKTKTYLKWMKQIGKVVPVHYQEPFRRAYGRHQPQVKDYLTDLRGARRGGAAGWCLHNGDSRGNKDGRPRRSFDMRQKRLFDQLDAVEMEVVREAQAVVKKGGR